MALCAVLLGCSSSPSPGDGERAIQDRIKEQSEGRIRLAKFQKTNGAQGELMGFKIYALEFDAEIEFTEDCKWITGMFGQNLSFSTSKLVAQPKSGFTWNKFMDDTQNPGMAVKKGQRAQVSGVIRFVKKEKGWAVDAVETSRAKLVGETADDPKQTAKQAAQPDSAMHADIAREQRIACANNLKKIGLSVRQWMLDHDDEWPHNVSTNKGGTKELCSQDNKGVEKNAAQQFQVLSNELASPEFLVCPADSGIHPAKNFENLLAANVSYRVRSGKNVSDVHPDEIFTFCPIHTNTLYVDGVVMPGYMKR